MSFTSQYPTQDASHVKATHTTFLGADCFIVWWATDPTKSLTAAWCDSANHNSWYSNTFYDGSPAALPLRFHIDLGAGFIIRRLYYENGYNQTGDLSCGSGVKDVVIQGSNSSTSFNDLDPTHDTGWTDLLSTSLLEHSNSTQLDPQYVDLTSNSNSYQYYAIKLLNNFADQQSSGRSSVRRFELQTQDGFAPGGSGQFLSTSTKYW